MQDYELMCIFNPNLPDARVDTAVEKVQKTIQDHQGTITHIEKFGRKDMATEFDKLTVGYYVGILLQLPKPQVQSFNQKLNLQEELVRFMMVKYVPKRVEVSAEVLVELSPEVQKEEGVVAA
jgi:small subunit ribosomal protein S6